MTHRPPQYVDVGTDGIISVASYNTVLFFFCVFLFGAMESVRRSPAQLFTRDPDVGLIDKLRSHVDPDVDWPPWIHPQLTQWTLLQRVARFFAFWRIDPAMQRVVGLDAWLYLQFQVELLVMLGTLSVVGLCTVLFVVRPPRCAGGRELLKGARRAARRT